MGNKFSDISPYSNKSVELKFENKSNTDLYSTGSYDKSTMAPSESNSLSSTTLAINQTSTSKTTPISQIQPLPRRNCRAPSTRKFAHPCYCSSQMTSTFVYHHSRQAKYNNNNPNLNNSVTSEPPAIANSAPFYLYEPTLKKCFPTSRQRDMLLRECHLPPVSSQVAPATISTLTSSPSLTLLSIGPTAGLPSDEATPSNSSQGNAKAQRQPQIADCFYSDLVCDPRKQRCICKPNYHLFFDPNSSSFGCIPIGNTLTSSPDKSIHCKPGYIYNMISKDCQRLFDFSELPPSHSVGPYVNQFSFLTIVMIWILLLMIILVTKLKRIRANALFGGSQGSGFSSSARRTDHYHEQSHRHDHHPHTTSFNQYLHDFHRSHNRHRSSASSSRHHHYHPNNRNQNFTIQSSWWPVIRAVNQMSQQQRNSERVARSVDESANFNDTDFFLANGTRRFGEILSESNRNGSQLSLNNPPPKFEEIYPTCTENTLSQHYIAAPQQPHLSLQEEQESRSQTPIPSNEDLPTYDEAMKLQNTKPPDPK